MTPRSVHRPEAVHLREERQRFKSAAQGKRD